MNDRQVVVIGAGPAGLSAGLALKDRGLRPLVVDRADRVGSSWRARYDRLRLNTCRPFSHLPGRRYPKGTPMFPSRDEVVEHLERHSREDGLDLQLGTHVDRIDRDDGAWAVRTSGGEVHAPQVIVATGYENTAFIPSWSGRERFEGRLLHSSEYMNAEPFRDRAVLVVGPGCSGMEIAYDLAEGGSEQGLAVGAHPAEHHAASGHRRPPGRHGGRRVAPRPATRRRRGGELREADGHRRPHRIRAAGSR